MAIKFYKCEICGNIVCKIEDSGMPLTCCGRQMTELRPSSTDGAAEKHVPVYEINDDTVYVKVGIEPHPMEQIHHIEFIVLETNKGFQLKKLDGSKDAVSCFKLCDNEKVISAYEYCNLHGLYKTP